MKIIFLVVGKTDEPYLLEGIAKYENRLKHYLSFQTLTIPALKNTKVLTESQQKQKEAELIMKNIDQTDYVVLLDEAGLEMKSTGFANWLEKHTVNSRSQMVFVIGGPYGVDDIIKKRANASLSLSKMTFSHQMVRLFFVEQLYRAMTILRNEPYHHA